MGNDIYTSMLSGYDLSTEQKRRNAIYEVNQQIILAGLYNANFFDDAAFYGGTCLRIFHGLQRFSEDMDFSLLSKNENFEFTKFFQPIIDEFALIGRSVTISKKEKHNFGKVESAFLKDNTDVYDVSFNTDKSIKIKIEVDTMPPLEFETEQKILLLPRSFMTRCFTLPNLFAGKMHALVFRNWKNRVKGRDWYDFEWYVRNRIPLNFAHLQRRILEFNDEMLTRNDFIALLKDKINNTSIEQVKADVFPFLKSEGDLKLWSNEYFLALSDMILFL